MSGSDSHGTPITLRSRDEQCKPIDIVNRYHKEFCDCFEKLQFTYDNYTLTCTPYHKDFVKMYGLKQYWDTFLPESFIVNKVDWNAFYKDSSTKSYYIHGKDNIPFHTIIYPALLSSLNEGYQLPNYIVSSEYLNVNDEKMSKSKGNGVTARELIEEYESDTIRYYMISQAPERKDSNFTYELLTQLHNKKLVGEYGNFVNRNLAFLVKKFNGVTPSGNVDKEVKNKIVESYNVV